MCATIIVYLFAKQMGKILSYLDLYILHAYGVFKTHLFNKLSKQRWTLDLHTMYLDTRYSSQECVVYIVWIMDLKTIISGQGRAGHSSSWVVCTYLKNSSVN